MEALASGAGGTAGSGRAGPTLGSPVSPCHGHRRGEQQRPLPGCRRQDVPGSPGGPGLWIKGEEGRDESSVWRRTQLMQEASAVLAPF